MEMKLLNLKQFMTTKKSQNLYQQKWK